MGITVSIREDLHQEVMDLCSESEDFNDVLENLLRFCDDDLEDFSDEKAAYYNECSERFMNGDRSSTREVDIDAIISRLEEKYGSI